MLAIGLYLANLFYDLNKNTSATPNESEEINITHQDFLTKLTHLSDVERNGLEMMAVSLGESHDWLKLHNLPSNPGYLQLRMKVYEEMYGLTPEQTREELHNFQRSNPAIKFQEIPSPQSEVYPGV